MATKIYKTYKEFKAREDKDLNGVSPRFAKENPNWKEDNETNRGCWNCVRCRDCSNCKGCIDCVDCVNCCITEWGVNLVVPIVKNIHQKVYEAASKPDALDMKRWHTCETTHCRAGWVVRLAGKDGRKLERDTSVSVAALLIYEASSPIRVRERSFYVNEEEALESMRKAAEAEKALNEGES